MNDSTSGLIIGTNLDDGRDVKSSKEYNIASRHGIKIYSEIEFDDFLFKRKKIYVILSCSP